MEQREESIAKRRNFQPVEDELESEEEGETPGGSLHETLPNMLAGIMSDKPETQLDATMKFRKWVYCSFRDFFADGQTPIKREEPSYRPCH